MRASSAVLTDTSVRLWDLVFPSERPLLARTRAAYVALDNLIAYSKRDRDAKIHAYLACYRPDETVLLFFWEGELVNAATLGRAGRFPLAISEAIKHIQAEQERGEISFQSASAEQLAAMYASCSQRPLDIGIDPKSPKSIFDTVLIKQFNGLLELISNNGVSYVSVKDGRFAWGVFSDQGTGEDAKACMARMFAGTPLNPTPRVVLKAFEGLPVLPHQAGPALVQVFREYVWFIVERAGTDIHDAGKRAERIRQKLVPAHEALKSVGGARGSTFADPIVEPIVFADGMAAWTKEFLTELEVLHPGAAPRLLKDACRDQRFQLSKLGFFDKLPWRIEW